MPPAGSLRSTGVTPLPRYYGPVRQALVFAALHLSARTATLLPRVFSAGRGALPCFHPCPCTRAAVLYPAERRVPRIGFGCACGLRRNCGGSAFGCSVDEASTGRSRIVAARVLAHPAQRGLVSGLRRRDLPRRRHSSYAAPIFYRFRTLTLWIHGYLQASLNYYCRAADNCRRALPAEAGRRARCEGQVAHTRRPVIRNCHLAGVGRWQFLPR